MGPVLLTVDTKELRGLETKLYYLRETAIPYAIVATLNDLAFDAQRMWQNRLPEAMIIRSQWTRRSIQVDKARPRKMFSVVGGVKPKGSRANEENHLLYQEYGRSERKRGSHGVVVPALSKGKRYKNRTPKKPTWKGIRGVVSPKGNSPAHRVAVGMAMARKVGRPLDVYLKLRGKHQGIYRLDPSASKLKVRKLWDLTKSSVKVPENPTMRPAVIETRKLIKGFWREALIFQLRRAQAFGF